MFISALFGFMLGAAGMGIGIRLRLGRFQGVAATIISQAEKERQARLEETALMCKTQLLDSQTATDAYRRQTEIRLEQRAEQADHRSAILTERLSDVDARLETLRAAECEISQTRQQLTAKLQAIAGISQHEATRRLVAENEVAIEQELAVFKGRKTAEAKAKANREATRIIATAIGRLAVETISENTTGTLSLPSDDMKARIIGREGRNVRALELATGCNIVIDDTPRTVIISSFDPLRKAIAKQALEQLVTDGRIHPTRIQEQVAKAERGVQDQILATGEEASLRAGVTDLHPELLKLLGQLGYRQSLGQNVLEHSIEVSALMGLMAGELGLNEPLAKRIGLLHDIGKAGGHQLPGSHARVGYALALRYQESEAVANGIGCHHHETEPKTIEGSLCSAADALSAARPGARSESIDRYVRRLKELEKMALELPGVSEAYALQSGREIRLIVEPNLVSDHNLRDLAHILAEKIEATLIYPGQIRVTVMRETRAIDYAR